MNPDTSSQAQLSQIGFCAGAFVETEKHTGMRPSGSEASNRRARATCNQRFKPDVKTASPDQLGNRRQVEIP